MNEIRRVLKPDGVAIITTPNIKSSLTRNPWYVREYSPQEIKTLVNKYFNNATISGIHGGDRVLEYQVKNKLSIAKFKRFDIFDFENKLPRSIIQLPYNLLNRINRNRLNKSNDTLVSSIDQTDFYLSDQLENCLDYFCILRK